MSANSVCVDQRKRQQSGEHDTTLSECQCSGLSAEFGHQYSICIIKKILDWFIQTDRTSCFFYCFLVRVCAEVVCVVSLEIPNELLVSLHETLPFSCAGHWPELSMQAVILIDQRGSVNSEAVETSITSSQGRVWMKSGAAVTLQVLHIVSFYSLVISCSVYLMETELEYLFSYLWTIYVIRVS